MKQYINGKYIDLTSEEIAAMQDQHADGGRSDGAADGGVLPGMGGRTSLRRGL